MLKEVAKEEAIMAALRGVPAFCMNTDCDPSKDDQIFFRNIRQEFLEDLANDTVSRFIIDDPEDNARPVVNLPVYDAEELASASKEAERSDPVHFAAKTQQNGAEAGQNSEKADQPKKSGKTARKDVDVGKMQALHNAGWSIAKIADEMHVSASVVQRRLAETARE